MEDQGEAWVDSQRAKALSGLDQPGLELGKRQEDTLRVLMDASAYYLQNSSRDKWAQTMVECASLYVGRRKGTVWNNIEHALAYYSQALNVFRPETHPLEWGECQRGIGRAFLKLADGTDRSLRDQCISHYGEALKVITREKWPELWHVIHLELSILYKRYAAHGAHDDEPLAQRHYQAALAIDKLKYPELHETLVRLHALHRELETMQQGVRALDDRREEDWDRSGRVAPGSYPPGAPTDPDVPN